MFQEDVNRNSRKIICPTFAYTCARLESFKWFEIVVFLMTFKLCFNLSYVLNIAQLEIAPE